MTVELDDTSWSRMYWRSWANLAEVRSRLAAGADPNVVPGREPPLHQVADAGSAEVAALLAPLVDDVDIEHNGRTALWTAVQADNLAVAEVLAAAGADPWRPMMNGWSPGRLSLASRNPGLFGRTPEGVELTPAEAAAVTESRRLIDALANLPYDGMSLCCVNGIDRTEVIRRLAASVVDDIEATTDYLWDGPLEDETLRTVGVTEVPGGCIVVQPWAFGASTPVVSRLLSAGTVCYAMYANPKSGNQGSTYRDGVAEGWDLHPGGGRSAASDPPDGILRTYLYRHKAVAYCCAYADVRPLEARPFTGPPDAWLRLPPRDYWALNT